MSATEQTAASSAAGTISKLVRVILGLVLLGMVALNVVSALCRYIFGIVFVGADEVLVFSMIWMVMVGMIVATAERRHIALDFLVTRANERQRIALSVLHHIVLTAACAYAAFYCLQFVARVAAVGQKSMALEFPMAIPHAALFVGFAGTAVASAILLSWDVAELARTSRAPK
jgi:TRAP-type C4-dicarboxylate transport system permease small subunit